MVELKKMRKMVWRAGSLPTWHWLVWLASVVVPYIILVVAEHNQPRVCATKVAVRMLFILLPVFVFFIFVVFPFEVIYPRCDLRIICKALPDYDKAFNNTVMELIHHRFKELVGQIEVLQSRGGSGIDRAEIIKKTELKPLFDAAKELGLLRNDVAMRGYDALFHQI